MGLDLIGGIVVGLFLGYIIGHWRGEKAGRDLERHQRGDWPTDKPPPRTLPW